MKYSLFKTVHCGNADHRPTGWFYASFANVNSAFYELKMVNEIYISNQCGCNSEVRTCEEDLK